jgi:hypothetical protein
MPTTFATRAFSLSVLAIVHLPLFVSVIAYSFGRKELSRKLVSGFSMKVMS